MGKKGSSSWLTAVKRAFRSPTKDTDKRSGRRREDCDQEEDEEKVFYFLTLIHFMHPFFLLLSLSFQEIEEMKLVCFCRREKKEDGFLEKL